MTIKTHGRMVTDNTVGIPQLAVTDGTSGQAIVTDGSGTMTFATVGAGGAVGSSTYIENLFTGDGTTATFTLSTGAPYEESILTFIDGVAQPTTSFTLPSTTSITFSPAPGNGAAIRVVHLGIASSVADNSITGAKLSMGGDVAGDILYYNGTDYQKLGIGTALQVLATNTAANAPNWVNAATAALPSVGADGNVLTSDGSDWSSQPPLGGVGGELVSIQLFDLNNFDTAGNGHGAGNSAPGPYILGTGTWTKPAGVQRIEVWVVGGGGSNSSNSQGGSTAGCPGAGGGGVAYSVFDVTNISSATYEIGMGGRTWLIGASTNNSAGPSEFVIGGVTMTANGGSQSTSGSASAGGAATGGNLLNEPGTGNLAGSDSERGINTLAPLKRLGLGAEACNTGGSNAGNAGGIFIKEYSDASASLVGEKLVSHQLFTSSSTATGTWTKPANITKIKVYVVGPGGASGHFVNTSHSGMGGGGGCALSVLDVTNVTSYPYVIGGTSMAGNLTVTSVDSSFNTTIVGGAGGSSAGGGTAGGSGGNATGGQLNFTGASGESSDGSGAGPLGGNIGRGKVSEQPESNWQGSGGSAAILVEEYSDASLVSGGSLVPTGVLNPYAGATAPAGWLLCFGQAISRTVYSTLFTAIGTTYGVGDGSTTFLLPDMRGRVAAGQDDMGGTSANRLTTAGSAIDGDVLGASVDEESHIHGTVASGGAFQVSGSAAMVIGSSVQPTIILNYIIKT